MKVSDVAVIGGGPAGLVAAAHLADRGVHAVVIDPLIGNHMANAGTIWNFPGFPEGVAGPHLAAMLQQQAVLAGSEFVPGLARAVYSPDGTLDGSFHVETDAEECAARSIVVASGSSIRVPRSGGAGQEIQVSHCATCDGPLFSGRSVAVIGGGDSALDEAAILVEYASSVTVICRGARLAAQPAVVKRAESASTLSIRLNTEVMSIEAAGGTNVLRVRDGETGNLRDEEYAGVFEFVGLEPNSSLVAHIVELDPAGHIVTDVSLQTSVPGVFAAGDIRSGSASTFAAASGDGATAAVSVWRYLQTPS